MDAEDKITNIDHVRSRFGKTVEFFDICTAELSDNEATLQSGDFKVKMFNPSKAKTLVSTFDVGKVNKAAFMIRSTPGSLAAEQAIQARLSSVTSADEAIKAFSTIAQASLTTLSCPSKQHCKHTLLLSC